MPSTFSCGGRAYGGFVKTRISRLTCAWSSMNRRLIAVASRRTSMYSSGSVWARPASYSGVSESSTDAASRSSSASRSRWRLISRSTASSGATAAYLTVAPGRRRREALVHEAAQHVVDALAGQVGLARDLGGREGLAPDERGVCPRLVGREAEASQARDEPASCPSREIVAATGRGVNVAMARRSRARARGRRFSRPAHPVRTTGPSSGWPVGSADVLDALDHCRSARRTSGSRCSLPVARRGRTP